MNPFFCRIGNKRPIAKKILKLIPQHKTYVEAFVGSGAVLFAKEPSEVEVINDLDKDVVENYRLLKSASADPKDYNTTEGIPNIQRFVDRRPITKEDKVLRNLYISCNTFGSKGTGKIFKEYAGNRKINKIDKYKERLKNVRVYNTDYKNVIKKYDSPTTFFFLDPPYENSEDLYKEGSFQFDELRDLLKTIKGKFLLTLNDSHNIRNIFKDFKIRGISVRGQGNEKSDIGRGVRKEVFIMNY